MSHAACRARGVRETPSAGVPGVGTQAGVPAGAPEAARAVRVLFPGRGGGVTGGSFFLNSKCALARPAPAGEAFRSEPRTRRAYPRLPGVQSGHVACSEQHRGAHGNYPVLPVQNKGPSCTSSKSVPKPFLASMPLFAAKLSVTSTSATRTLLGTNTVELRTILYTYTISI